MTSNQMKSNRRKTTSCVVPTNIWKVKHTGTNTDQNLQLKAAAKEIETGYVKQSNFRPAARPGLLLGFELPTRPLKA